MCERSMAWVLVDLYRVHAPLCHSTATEYGQGRNGQQTSATGRAEKQAGAIAISIGAHIHCKWKTIIYGSLRIEAENHLR